MVQHKQLQMHTSEEVRSKKNRISQNYSSGHKALAILKSKQKNECVSVESDRLSVF